MIREVKWSAFFDSYTSKHYDKYRHIKKYVKKIDKDAEFVINLLKQDKPIPPRFKNHKVDEDSEGNDIRELHLVARGSDTLLIYKKYANILYLYAITDHKGLNKILHGSVLLIDLSDDELENTVFS